LACAAIALSGCGSTPTTPAVDASARSTSSPASVAGLSRLVGAAVTLTGGGRAFKDRPDHGRSLLDLEPWLASLFPAPTPNALNTVDAWGLDADFTFAYSHAAMGTIDAARRFGRALGRGVDAACAALPTEVTWLHALDIGPVSSSERFLEALEWRVTGAGWRWQRPDPGLAAATASSADGRGHLRVVFRAGRFGLYWGAPVDARGPALEAVPAVHAALGLELLGAPLGGLETAGQLEAASRDCRLLEGEVRAARLSARIELMGACLQRRLAIDAVVSRVDAEWAPSGPLTLAMTLGREGRASWARATAAPLRLPADPAAWATLSWTADRDAFVAGAPELSALPVPLEALWGEVQACGPDSVGSTLYTLAAVAPVVLSGIPAALLGELGLGTRAAPARVVAAARSGAAVEADAVWAELESSGPLLDDAAWLRLGGTALSAQGDAQATRALGDTVLRVERNAASGRERTRFYWSAAEGTTTDSGAVSPAGGSADEHLWLRATLRVAQLAKLARTRGQLDLAEQLDTLAARGSTVEVSGVRTDERIVYRLTAQEELQKGPPDR
jgi:hypothetical protein